MMKIFPTQSVKKLDAYTIEHEPVAEIDLMERASLALAEEICSRFSAEVPFVVFAGPGNNGGDALAVARLMAERGYRLSVYLFNVKGALSPCCQTNRNRLSQLSGVEFHEVTSQFAPPALTPQHVVIDGLFGSGLNKPLAGGFASVVRYVNASPAYVIAIDVPSGLMGEDNTYNTMAQVMNAHLTLTLQFPKLAFLLPENAQKVGEWKVLDIGLHPQGIEQTPTPYALTEPAEMRELLKPRARFAHKGDFGRALLIAGKLGMAGASILAARACLRSGVGLLTVHVPQCNNPMLQTAVPEAMTQIDIHPDHFAEAPLTDAYNAVGVGPGLGKHEDTRAALLELLDHCQIPMVLDADALNILGDEREHLYNLPLGSIITPHPGEMDRLVGRSQSSYLRLQKARELAREAQVCIVLKGAYTAVIDTIGQCWFNPTGNPGMATGGSGDVLTGILTALLAQGIKAIDAARLGVYIHGLAADLAAADLGEVSLTAHDIIDYLPAAFRG